MRKRKGGEKPNYQPGAFAGLLQHRHGENLRNKNGSIREVYRPGGRKPVAPPINSDKHTHLVESVAAVLAEWKTTKFEHEGSCRAGLRAAWCTEGFDWASSDAAAAKIVSDALHKIGARRPTWEQGQREHTDPVECCTWCKGQIPDELFYRPTPARFCSDVCAKSAMQHRDFENRSSSDRAYAAAVSVVLAHRQPVRSCACCSKKFRSRERTQIYCSETCANRHRVVEQVFQKACRCCGEIFSATYADATYCSANCRSKFAMLSSGNWKPKRLSPVVFDFYLTDPVNCSLSAWLSPVAFDRVFAATA